MTDVDARLTADEVTRTQRVDGRDREAHDLYWTAAWAARTSSPIFPVAIFDHMTKSAASE